MPFSPFAPHDAQCPRAATSDFPSYRSSDLPPKNKQAQHFSQVATTSNPHAPWPFPPFVWKREHHARVVLPFAKNGFSLASLVFNLQALFYVCKHSFSLVILMNVCVRNSSFVSLDFNLQVLFYVCKHSFSLAIAKQRSRA
jgi:hypothetical protein